MFYDKRIPENPPSYTKKERKIIILYTVADTHLSFAVDKPMDLFGTHWENHAERLKEAWCRLVTDADTVVMPGDISWGSSFEEAYADLLFLHELPGRKIIGKGNHDYWWATMNKLSLFKEEKKLTSIDFLYNNAYAVENKIICGTRGWVREFGVKSEDERLIKREAARLELSLREGMKLKEQFPENEVLVFLHYPPLFGEFMNYDILDVLYRYDIKNVYFGHLHNIPPESYHERYLGIEMHLISADYVRFEPQRIP